MTKEDISVFVNKLGEKKNSVVRLKGNRKSPTREVRFKNAGITYYPEVEIELNNKTDIYEFEKGFNSGKISILVTKWIILSIKAKMMSGQFYLVVEEQYKHKFQRIISEKLLDIKLMTI
ncbi:MAG: hypothetical protein H6582_08320 [Crocinitomicaceae bacterium]|nr:hypothetical protein [Crocinitomicaceae bacterium]